VQRRDSCRLGSERLFHPCLHHVATREIDAVGLVARRQDEEAHGARVYQTARLQCGDSRRIELQNNDAGQRLIRHERDGDIDTVIVWSLNHGDRDELPRVARTLLDSPTCFRVAVSGRVTGVNCNRLGVRGTSARAAAHGRNFNSSMAASTRCRLSSLTFAASVSTIGKSLRL